MISIDDIFDWFSKKKWFKVTKSIVDENTLYLFAYNSLRLGHIEKYNNDSFICYYRVGKKNDKEHNLIIKSIEDLEILSSYLYSIFDREYGANNVVIDSTPTYIKGKPFYKTQKMYDKKIPKKEFNLKS